MSTLDRLKSGELEIVNEVWDAYHGSYYVTLRRPVAIDPDAQLAAARATLLIREKEYAEAKSRLSAAEREVRDALGRAQYAYAVGSQGEAPKEMPR